MSNKRTLAVDFFATALYERGLLIGNENEIQVLLDKAKEKELSNIWHSIQPYVDLVYETFKPYNKK